MDYYVSEKQTHSYLKWKGHGQLLLKKKVNKELFDKLVRW